MMDTNTRQKSFLRRWWRLLVILITPLVLLPLPIIIKTIQARCAYVVILLTIYWVSESMPYAVTSLFPLCFFPLAGILTYDRVGLSYFNDIATLFVGSMILAHAMEHVRLHRRLALLVLSFVGSSIKWSMAGLMAVTAFLSMWINNSAATSIMIPAAVAVINELQQHDQEAQEKSVHPEFEIRRKSKDILPVESTIVFEIKTIIEERRASLATIHENAPVNSNGQANGIPPHRPSVNYDKLKTGFLIAVAYSSAVGGLGTLVGTGPNIFTKGYADKFHFEGPNAFEVSFTNFLLYAFPIGIVMLVVCWLWLQFVYNRKELLPWIKKDPRELESQKHMQAVLKEQYKELGSPSWQECTIIILFVLMVLLWVTRDFSSAPGWAIIFPKGYVSDGTVAILLGSLPLIIPNKNPFSENWEYDPILEWEHLSRTFPWGVFMLQGAGLVIADGFRESDLSSTIGTFLQFIVKASDLTIILVVIVVTAVFTEFTSNLACASILFPVLDSIALTTGIHAARLLLPCCMAASLSFMLPIATPPNAMIFSTGNVRIIDMIKVGFAAKVIGIGVIFLFSITTLSPIFRLHPITAVLNDTSLLGNHTSR